MQITNCNLTPSLEICILSPKIATPATEYILDLFAGWKIFINKLNSKKKVIFSWASHFDSH